ncbi:MAG: SCP2 sterol-binding domain-containing protein [Pseudomonadota bacterium]
MSDILDKALELLSEKLGDADIGSTVKFAIEDVGSLVIDGSGVRIGDDETDVTLSADADTFQGVLSGDVNPTAAFMQGKLSVDGDMGAAMKLASLLG